MKQLNLNEVDLVCGGNSNIKHQICKKGCDLILYGIGFIAIYMLASHCFEFNLD